MKLGTKVVVIGSSAFIGIVTKEYKDGSVAVLVNGETMRFTAGGQEYGRHGGRGASLNTSYDVRNMSDEQKEAYVAERNAAAQAARDERNAKRDAEKVRREARYAKAVEIVARAGGVTEMTWAVGSAFIFDCAELGLTLVLRHGGETTSYDFENHSYTKCFNFGVGVMTNRDGYSIGSSSVTAASPEAAAAQYIVSWIE